MVRISLLMVDTPLRELWEAARGGPDSDLVRRSNQVLQSAVSWKTQGNKLLVRREL